MKTPSQIIRERIELVDTSPYFASDKKGILEVLQFILPLIEEYENNSVERLLEEIGYSATLVNMKTYWVAQTTNSSQSGATPQEALQKLKSKLNNQ